MRHLNPAKVAFLVLAFFAATASVAFAQTFSAIANLSATEAPVGAPVQGTDGNFYGLSIGSGNCDFGFGGTVCGAFYRLTPSGTVTTLYTFVCSQTCAQGYNPNAGLVQGTDGKFYGTTGYGGAHNAGTVFKIGTSGKLTTLYNFCAKTNCQDGSGPGAGLVLASDGNFYGTTAGGGTHSLGTVFKITTAGKLTTLYSFCSKTNCTDGSGPMVKLVQAKNGKLYGITSHGGTQSETWCSSGSYSNCGTIFNITTAGRLITLYNFCSEANCSDPAPGIGLTLASDGNLYGADGGGGTSSYGFIFRLTPSGKFTNVYNFSCSQTCPDGFDPDSPLIQGSNGHLFGTMYGGGVNFFGTVFEYSLAGAFTTLYAFQDSTDGAYPAGIAQDQSGDLYGLTLDTAFTISGVN